jgi:hypothetical protein
VNRFEALFRRTPPWAAALLLISCGGNETPTASSALTDAVAREYGRGATAAGSGNPGDANGTSSPDLAAPGENEDDAEPPAMDVPAPDEAEDDEDEPVAPEPEPSESFPDCDGFSILQANCGQSGCHGEGSMLGSTFASSEADARSYIGRSGTLTCGGQGPLIDPENPSESVIVLKMSDDPPCGNYMPPSGMFLPDDDVECVTNWIGNLE